MKKKTKTTATEFERSCNEISELIENWGDSERKFALMKLVEYYLIGLLDDFDFIPKDEEDFAIKRDLRKKINVCDAIHEDIRKELSHG